MALASVRDAAGGLRRASSGRPPSGGDAGRGPGGGGQGRGWPSLDELSGAAAEMLEAFGVGHRRPPRRGVAGPAAGRLLAPGVAPGGAAAGRRAARRPAVRPAHGGADLGDAGAGRVVRAAGPAVGPAADRRDGSRPGQSRSRAEHRRGRGGRAAPAGLDRAGRRLAVRPPAQRDPVRRPAPAAARPRRAARGLPDRAARADRARPAAGRSGLFSSMRAARQAAAELREPLELPAAVPGRGRDRRCWSASSPRTRRPACSARSRCGRAWTCPAGRSSSWSSTGSRSRARTTRWPRPASAPWRRTAATGSCPWPPPQAALLLAQGAGRLLRTMSDKGVVAVLDPRLATARYGGFLRASLPPFWTTTDPEVVRGALRRLAGPPPPLTHPRPQRHHRAGARCTRRPR